MDYVAAGRPRRRVDAPVAGRRPRRTVDEFAGAADEATDDRTTDVIVPKSPTLGQMQTLIEHVARARAPSSSSPRPTTPAPSTTC